MTDEELQTAYAELLAGRAGQARSDCPAPDLLADAAAGKGAEPGRLRVLDHAMACPECRREFELLRALRAGRPRRPGWVGVAWAAAAVLVVAIGIGLMRQGGVAGDTMRGGNEGVVLVAPGPSVSGTSPLEFSWRRVPLAVGYRLTITTPDGRVRAEDETPDTALVLRAALEPGDYRWWVTALLQDGGTLAARPRDLRVAQ